MKRWQRTAWILPAVLAGGLLAAAAGPATTQAAGPREVVEGMFRAILAGDEAETLSALVFGSADSRAAAEAVLRQVLATARLRQAVVQQFGVTGQDTPVGKKEEDDARAMLKAVAAAGVREEPGGAHVTLDNGQTFRLVEQRGAWKVDFDKSQAGMGGMPSKADVEAAKKRTTALEALTRDVVSHRIASLPAIEARYQGIMSDADEPSTAPATRP